MTSPLATPADTFRDINDYRTISDNLREIVVTGKNDATHPVYSSEAFFDGIDTTREPAAEGADGPDGDDGTAEATFTIIANLTGEVRATGLTSEAVAVWMSNRYDTSVYTVTPESEPVVTSAEAREVA